MLQVNFSGVDTIHVWRMRFAKSVKIKAKDVQKHNTWQPWVHNTWTYSLGVQLAKHWPWHFPIYINFLQVFQWNSQDLRKKTAFDKITVETSLTRGWYMYLGMLSMIWTHPHATWHCRQWRINTIHVKCQRTEVAMNKPASQFTPTKQKTSEIYHLMGLNVI